MRKPASYLSPQLRPWLLAAAGCGLPAFLAGTVVSPVVAWSTMLTSSFFFLTLALGALVFLAILSVANAGWHSALKRVPEALAAYLPVGALTTVVMLAGAPQLYHWAQAEAVAHDAVLQAKTGYLNVPFFALRMIVILAIWIAFAVALRRNSVQQDGDGKPQRTQRSVVLSALLLVVFPFSFSLASIDWLMSLEPHWASTLFGFYNISGLLSAAVAVTAVTIVLLRRRGELAYLNGGHFHDLGKLLFGFCTVWMYLWFSQYLLIWYTNMAEETPYYLARTSGGWAVLFYLNVVINWVIPFVVLLPRATKCSERAMLRVSLLVLAGRWLDIFLMVAPAVRQGYGGPGILDVAVFLALGALFVLVVDRALVAVPLLAKNDPYLVEGLHHGRA